MRKESKGQLPVKWEPLIDDMLAFKKTLDRQFENFFSGHPFMTGLPSFFKKEFSGWKPDVDMYETADDVIVKADMPGCEKKDIRVDLNDNVLTISGEKREEKEIKKRNFYHKEQHAGAFYRSMTLPLYADRGHPKAIYEKGVLKIIFPKTTQAGKGEKRIEITEK